MQFAVMQALRAAKVGPYIMALSGERISNVVVTGICWIAVLARCMRVWSSYFQRSQQAWQRTVCGATP